ncbi:MAG: hypothetical protein ACFE0O_02050 [Opitutales bacterium]
MDSNQALLLKANRLFGVSLVRQGLIADDALEEANGIFLESLHAEGGKTPSLLRVLLHETQQLDEAKLLAHLVDDHGLGLCQLSRYDCDAQAVYRHGGLYACKLTATVPFDFVEGFTFIATAYYLSPPVRQFWQEWVDGPVIWYGAPFQEIQDNIEALEAEESTVARVVSVAS